MSSKALYIYHSLPGPLRSVVASLRGYYLRSWRYGADTEEQVSEAKEREKWSRERWQVWQQERLAYVLQRAANQVPFYREQWAERRRRGDRASAEILENWPILEKESVRANPRQFIAADCNSDKMFHEHTSGTTGKSLDLWWSAPTVRAWYSLFEARWRRWYGVNCHDRWGMLGGQLVTPVDQRRPPFWVWNAGLNQLYLSSYHLAPDLIPHYLEALIRYRVTYLWGYSSSLYSLAKIVLESGLYDLKMKVVITNAEPLFPNQREIISKAFQCPVRETYGMAEIVTAASECEAGRLHLWPEVGITEVFEHGKQASEGVSGDMVCTGLFNADMPLIRYKLGDRCTFPLENEICACGRTLPLLRSIEGRADDEIYTHDGRAIGRLDPIFKANLPVYEAQIVQESLCLLRVRYVPTPEFTPQAAQSISERLRARFGEVEVILEPCVEIPRTSNGKFRAVICNLSADEKLKLTRRSGVSNTAGLASKQA